MNYIKSFKNTLNGVNKKTQRKDEKRQINKILKDTFRLAQANETAVFKYEEETYVLESLSRRRLASQNGGIYPPEKQWEKDFVKSYQQVHLYLRDIDPAGEFSDVFTEVDQFTFPFAQDLGNIGTKNKASILRMKKTLGEWQAFTKSELMKGYLESLEPNNGKLT